MEINICVLSNLIKYKGNVNNYSKKFRLLIVKNIYFYLSKSKLEKEGIVFSYFNIEQ